MRLFRRSRPYQVSSKWLKAHHRQSETRIVFEGVRIMWPINKLINEASRFNATRLRKKA